VNFLKIDDKAKNCPEIGGYSRRISDRNNVILPLGMIQEAWPSRQ
jgi:hypothetical protein